MKFRFGSVVAVALSLGISGFTLAADGDRPAADKPPGERTAGDRPGPGPRAGGGAGFGRGMPFTLGGVAEAMVVLGDLNMSPDFTLSKDQKVKIHGIREEFAKEQEKWRNDHDADLKKFQAQIAELRDKGQGENREKRQEIFKSQVEFFSTAPKGEEQVKAIKAALEPEQLKQFEARLSQRREGGREGRPQGAPGERNPAPKTDPK